MWSRRSIEQLHLNASHLCERSARASAPGGFRMALDLPSGRVSRARDRTHRTHGCSYEVPEAWLHTACEALQHSNRIRVRRHGGGTIRWVLVSITMPPVANSTMKAFALPLCTTGVYTCPQGVSDRNTVCLQPADESRLS